MLHSNPRLPSHSVMRTSLTTSLLLIAVLCSHAAQSADLHQSAPRFSLPQVNATQSRPVKLSQYAGQVIYLDFWASWCPPCRQSFPFMQSLQTRFAEQGFTVIGGSVDQEEDELQDFLEQYPVDFPILWDRSHQIVAQYGIAGMPTSLLIDRNGTIQRTHQGFRKSDQIQITRWIEQVLQQ